MLDLSLISNLAITGANGFVGKSVIETISGLPIENRPKKITLITRQGLNFQLERDISNRTTLVSHDLGTPWNFTGEISHLLNLAADGSNNPYSHAAAIQFEAISRNLITWLSKLNSSPRIFHASSGACFGSNPVNQGEMQSTDKELFISNRLKVERLLLENASKLGFELSVGRLFSFSGRNILPKKQYALSNFISTALNSGQINISGDPSTLRSYLHQDAMSEWILKALQTKNLYVDLQIGSDNAVTIRELAEFVAENTSADVQYASFPTPGDIYIPVNYETRIKLGVEEGLNWKAAVLEMITEARKSKNDAK